MAIYHFSGKVIGRANTPGASAVAGAAYRSAEHIGEHDYTKKEGVGWSGMLFPEGCPDRLRDREALWSEVDRVEKRKDAQLYRSFDFAFPNCFSLQDCVEVVTVFAGNEWVSQGMVADLSVHCNPGNLHGHAMLTLRDITEDGFGKKNRAWNEHDLMEKWRVAWEEAVNSRLRALGQTERIDHRSYEDQGVPLTPTKHLGRFRAFLERMGICTSVGDHNRAVQADNDRVRGSLTYKVGQAERWKRMDVAKRDDYCTACFGRMNIDLQKQIDQACGTDFAREEMIRRHNARLAREKEQSKGRGR